MAEETGIKLNMLEPRATEKSYLEQTNRIYIFPVKKSMSKQAIAKRVEDEYNVKVTDVRTMIRKGKKTRYSKGKHAYPGTTYRQDKKFAYVRLAKGNSIRVFDDENQAEEPKKTNKTSAKEAKKAEKVAEKTTKKAEKADKNAGKEKK